MNDPITLKLDTPENVQATAQTPPNCPTSSAPCRTTPGRLDPQMKITTTTGIPPELKTAAPSIAFRITWEHDEDAPTGPNPDDITNIYNPDNGLDGEDPDDWQAWQTDVSAACIIAGELRAGHDYLSGTYERAIDDPTESNPTISGYLPDMLDRALDELDRIPGSPDHEIRAAREIIVNMRKART